MLRLEDVERPVPADDEVLVRVHATTVTRTDCGFRAAHPWFMRGFTAEACKVLDQVQKVARMHTAKRPARRPVVGLDQIVVNGPAFRCQIRRHFGQNDRRSGGVLVANLGSYQQAMAFFRAEYEIAE